MTVLSFVAVAVLLAGIVLVPVVLMRRMRSSTDPMNALADDLRRSGDGGGPNPAAGPGLGPMWPTD